MPFFSVSAEDRAKILDSEKFHFVHGVAAVKCADGSFEMAYSNNLAEFLRRDLGVQSTYARNLTDPPPEGSEIYQPPT